MQTEEEQAIILEQRYELLLKRHQIIDFILTFDPDANAIRISSGQASFTIPTPQLNAIIGKLNELANILLVIGLLN